MDDEELLNLVVSEQRRSVGFDLDAELVRQRELALEYYKGAMPDVPAMPNRSQAVSMDVRDGIQAILPDLLEIFTGGDDVVSFAARNQDDEEAAQQETDYLRYVIFDENDGWSVFNTVILDALQAKTGVFKWWVQEGDQPKEERFEGKTAVELQAAAQQGEIVDARLCDDQAETGLAGEQLYDFTLRYPQEDGAVRIAAVAPEDITVARDTVRLKDATYCATRSRPRAQDLINQGIDPDLVDQLPEWLATISNAVPQARDTVREGQQALGSASTRLLRQVEVVEHYVRLRDDNGEKIYCVLTGGTSAPILLRKQEVNQIQLASITPFTVSHRFYGNSLADFLIDIQKIKSQLQRMSMDAGYFALNQRYEVAEDRANANTVPDLLRNEPGVPVRSKNGGAVTAISGVGLNFNTLQHLEYFSTVAEERTGIVRAAQGLNPDTLHETKAGALAQLSRASRRIRMIARTFAETGVKDMFLGVHALLRESASKARITRLRGKWVAVNPSQWASRTDMRVEIGLGSGGRDYDMAVMDRVISLQRDAVQAQGGMAGPLVTPRELFNSANRFAEKAGIKSPEMFFRDPGDQPPQQPEQGPDPALVELQAKMALEGQKAQASQQLDAAKMDRAHEIEIARLQMNQQTAQAELDLKREQLAAELDLKREQLAAEMQLKREQMSAEIALQTQLPNGGDLGASGADIGEVYVGGDPG